MGRAKVGGHFWWGTHIISVSGLLWGHGEGSAGSEHTRSCPALSPEILFMCSSNLGQPVAFGHTPTLSRAQGLQTE